MVPGEMNRFYDVILVFLIFNTAEVTSVKSEPRFGTNWNSSVFQIVIGGKNHAVLIYKEVDCWTSVEETFVKFIDGVCLVIR